MADALRIGQAGMNGVEFAYPTSWDSDSDTSGSYELDYDEMGNAMLGVDASDESMAYFLRWARTYDEYQPETMFDMFIEDLIDGEC